MQTDSKKWIAVVRTKDKGFEMTTNFYSDTHEIENIIHKVELDLMTNLHHGYKNPVEVEIAEIKNG